MPKTLKIIIVTISVIATILVIFIFSKISPIIFPYSIKLQADNKSFELIKLYNLAGNDGAQAEYIAKGKDYPASKEIEESAIDYYKKISTKIKDDNLKLMVNISWVGYSGNYFDVYSFYGISSKMDQLNNQRGFIYPYRWFEASYLKKQGANDKVIFQGFDIPGRHMAAQDPDFGKLVQNYYPDTKFD